MSLLYKNICRIIKEQATKSVSCTFNSYITQTAKNIMLYVMISFINRIITP